MVGWKDREGMEFEKVEEVVKGPTQEHANRLLKDGWILLDVGVVQLGNKDGGMKGGVNYVFGWKKGCLAK